MSNPRPLLPLRLHPQLYEISVLPWLVRLSKQLGRSIRICDVPRAEWERFHALGLDLIYLMGMWRRSPMGHTLSRSQTSLFSRYDECLPGWTLEDVSGSPFSIQAYEPDPSIGSWEDLGGLQEQLHELGMRLILDVIPNHTGPDHSWVREHPEYYIRGTLAGYRSAPGNYFISENAVGGAEVIAYGRDPYFAPWTDTAQLNYFNSGLRSAMIEQIRRISGVCDGARCDMAMLMLNDNFHQTWEPLLGSTPAPREEFWQEATRALPHFIWIAEAYSDSEWALQQLGFNFTYDKRLYDRLRDGFVRDVYLHLKADWDFQMHSVRFLENHDEPRAMSVFNARMPAAVVLAATVPGMHFFNDGQFEGFRTQMVVQLARARDERVDPEVYRMYERLLRIIDAPEFHGKDWRLLEARDTGDGTSSDIIAYVWKGDTDAKLVMVNLGAGTSSARLDFPDELFSGRVLAFRDLLSDLTYQSEVTDLKNAGLLVKEDGFGARIFEVKQV